MHIYLGDKYCIHLHINRKECLIHFKISWSDLQNVKVLSLQCQFSSMQTNSWAIVGWFQGWPIFHKPIGSRWSIRKVKIIIGSHFWFSLHQSIQGINWPWRYKAFDLLMMKMVFTRFELISFQWAVLIEQFIYQY